MLYSYRYDISNKNVTDLLLSYTYFRRLAFGLKLEIKKNTLKQPATLNVISCLNSQNATNVIFDEHSQKMPKFRLKIHYLVCIYIIQLPLFIQHFFCFPALCIFIKSCSRSLLAAGLLLQCNRLRLQS